MMGGVDRYRRGGMGGYFKLCRIGGYCQVYRVVGYRPMNGLDGRCSVDIVATHSGMGTVGTAGWIGTSRWTG